MKKILCGVLIASLNVSLLSGCGKTGSSQAPENQKTQVPEPETFESVEEENGIVQGTETGKDGGDIKFTVIFGALGDNGYNDEMYKGCQVAVGKFGCSFDYVKTRDVSEVEIQMRSYTDAGDYDVIISISTGQVDTLEMVAEEYPDQKLCMLSAAIDGHDNISCLAAAYPDQHFLSGVLAGLATKDDRFPLSNPENILGFCITVDTSTSRGQAAGFIAGAKYANPDVEVLANYIGGYGDPATTKESALVMYRKGADIASANAGNSTQDIFYAAEEENQYVIGTSLAMAGPKHSLSTSCKKMWLFVVGEIQMLVDGTWTPGSKMVGIPERICDYDAEELDVQVPDDMTKILDDTRQLVADGKLVLLTDADQVEEQAKENHLDP